MSHKNFLVYMGALVTLSLGVGFNPTPAGAQQLGELNDNNVAIIPLCNCVESEEASKSSQCQKLFAQQNPQQQPRQGAGGVHALGGIAPPIQQ